MFWLALHCRPDRLGRARQGHELGTDFGITLSLKWIGADANLLHQSLVLLVVTFGNLSHRGALESGRVSRQVAVLATLQILNCYFEHSGK